MRWPNADLDSVLGVSKKPTLCLHAVSDDEGHPLENEDESGRMPREYRGPTPQARVEGPRHHQSENLSQYVQKAPDDIRWSIDRTEFDELIATKKDSAPGPDGIPYGAERCAGGLSSQFLYNAYTYLLEGGTLPEHFAESRTLTALAPAFHSVDHIAGLNLNYRECCWVLYGGEGRESLRTWISENWEEFPEMQIVRHAKYVGTMIGPDGFIHRWTAHRKKSSSAF